MSSHDVVVAGALRTPIGKFAGALSGVSSVDLAVTAVRALMTRVNLPATVVDYVIMGTCIQSEVALQANISARQVLLKSGLPPETLSLSIDRACCSSLTAVHLGVKEIVTGGADVVLAIGSDNMGRAPYLVPRRAGGQRVGHLQMIDPMYELGYADWAPVAVDAAEVAIEHGVTREQQDRWAFRSQQRYAEALAAGKFSEEIIAVDANEGGTQRTIIERDEQPRPNTTPSKIWHAFPQSTGVRPSPREMPPDSTLARLPCF